ncbi:MAG TPA: hypothetical protein VMY35_00910 [Phycisphaerae bacterium]|nr:hypothetical protein [Phycisphaerae bacterium]
MSERTRTALVNLVIGLVIVAGMGAAIWALLQTDPTGEDRRGVGRELLYDQTAVRHVDAALVGYRETARFAAGFETPRALAVGPDDRIYVAGDGAVRLFGPDGAPAGHFGTAGEPRCLAVASDGTIFVGMDDHVEVLDAGGVQQAVWPSPGPGTLLRSLAVAGDLVFAADAGNRIVYAFDRSGRLLRRIGKASTGDEEDGFFLRSTEHFDLAAAADPGAPGLWVANAGRFHIEKWTPDGELKWWWGAGSTRIEDFFGCCNPAHIALVPGGGFVTSEKGLPRVKLYSAEGVFRTVVAPPEVFREEATNVDVAVDSRGRVLVLDPTLGMVRFFEATNGSDGKE